MNPLALLWRGRTDVFHIRMGGCSGCAAMVDSLLRDGRWPGILDECASPHHAALLIVSGLWAPGLTDPVLDVISQAPSACRVILVGDCALGTGTFAGRGRPWRETPSGQVQGTRVAGCPVGLAELTEAVRRVSG